METRWLRLDNASNIFLAARNDIDTKVFRLSAEMTDIVDPVLLQAALEKTYRDYPLFHTTLRRGIFWYYLEEKKEKPRVRPETEPPCSPIYYDNREFLFRVLYRGNKIHFEVFHALTDGTGAMWFFEDLLVEYGRLRSVKEENRLGPRTKREKADLEDSFNRYFKSKKKEAQLDKGVESLEKIYEEKEIEKTGHSNRMGEPVKKKTYHIKGEYTPDHRPRIIHLNLPAKKALDLARSEKVSLTIYLTALYMMSIYKTEPNKKEETTISVSIPINLRQFFPSVSVRNFFSTTSVSYIFKRDKEPDLSGICQEIDGQFKKQLGKAELEGRLRKYIEFEFNPVARILPRPVKDLILKGVNKWNNRKITAAMSNLGIVRLPDQIKDTVENVYFYTSVIRPQFCMISYGDNLNISFTSPFIETEIHHNFVRLLSEEGLEGVIDVNKVSKKELDEG